MKASVAVPAGGGLLLALAFPPFGFDFLAWIAFVPLLLLLEQDCDQARAPVYGAVFGLGFFAVDMSWIYSTVVTHGHFATIPAVLTFFGLVLVLAAFPTSFAAAVVFCSRRGLSVALVAPFVWTATEYLRSTVFTGFPWDLAGYSQTSRLHVVQIADLTGVYGISFLILLVNGTVAEQVRSAMQKERPLMLLLGTTLLVAVLTLAYGHFRIQDFPEVPASGPTCQIGVLQGNIPQDEKWEIRERENTFNTYEKLGAKAVQEGARLLIWPETSVPVLFGVRDPDAERPGDISLRLDAPMLVGAPYCITANREDHYYNSAFLMEGHTIKGRYDKMHLVPFGEYMPLSWLLPLGPGIAAREADYSPGESMTVMSLEGCPTFSVLICYEAIFPELARMAVSRGAQLLVNITNDGWFGATGAPYQHLAMAGLRSVENRVWLLRSANTGVSAAFDPAGRMVKSIPLQQSGHFVVQAPCSEEVGSFYSRFGDIFAWFCISASGFLFLWCFFNRGMTKSRV
jgi:apolipoprotein N-acyltransferase